MCFGVSSRLQLWLSLPLPIHNIQVSLASTFLSFPSLPLSLLHFVSIVSLLLLVSSSSACSRLGTRERERERVSSGNKLLNPKNRVKSLRGWNKWDDTRKWEHWIGNWLNRLPTSRIPHSVPCVSCKFILLSEFIQEIRWACFYSFCNFIFTFAITQPIQAEVGNNLVSPPLR